MPWAQIWSGYEKGQSGNGTGARGGLKKLDDRPKEAKSSHSGGQKIPVGVGLVKVGSTENPGIIGFGGRFWGLARPLLNLRQNECRRMH
jgi:hypothetical protein